MKTFQLPLLMLGLVGVLTACPGPDVPKDTISANFQGTTTGASLPSGVARLDTPNETITTNDGTFTSPNSINIQVKNAPQQDALYNFLPTNGGSCNFTGTKSDTPGMSFVPNAVVFSQQGDPLGSVEQAITSGGSAANSLVARLYSTSAATISGITKCTDGSLHFDVSLSSGWNVVETYSVGNDIYLKNLASGVKAELKAYAFKPEVLVVLSPSELTFLNASTGPGIATAEAHLLQIGGYSGTVKLSTNIPELTVEPSTLTLNPLAAQMVKGGTLASLGLREQRLDANLTFKYLGENVSGKAFNLIVTNPAGTQVGGGQGTVSASRPGFTLSAGTEVYGYPGEIRPLYVSLSGTLLSQTITLTVDSNAAGITAMPTPVQFNAGSGSAQLPLNVPAGTTPGIYPVTITATSNDMIVHKEVQVKVLPARTALGQGSTTSIELAPNGDQWISVGADVVQFRNGQVISRVTLPSSTVPATPAILKVANDGTVWAKAQGVLYHLVGPNYTSYPIGGYGMDSQPKGFALDSQGRPWYMFFDGFHVPELRYWDLVNNQSVSVSVPSANTANQAVTVFNDVSKEHVFYIDANGYLVMVNTKTLQMTVSPNSLVFSSVGESFRQSFIDRDGQLWIYSNGPAQWLKRIDTNTLTATQTVNLTALGVLAQIYSLAAIENSSTGWFYINRNNTDTVLKVDLATGTQTNYPMDISGQKLYALGLSSIGISYVFDDAANNLPSSYLRDIK